MIRRGFFAMVAGAVAAAFSPKPTGIPAAGSLWFIDKERGIVYFPGALVPGALGDNGQFTPLPKFKLELDEAKMRATLKASMAGVNQQVAALGAAVSRLSQTNSAARISPDC
jgi:hypothetical protein